MRSPRVPPLPTKGPLRAAVFDERRQPGYRVSKVSFDSLNSSVKPNADGSCTMWFDPKAPEGHEGNWIQTMPGKSYDVLLRLYGPLEPWFDKTWKPGPFGAREGRVVSMAWRTNDLQWLAARSLTLALVCWVTGGRAEAQDVRQYLEAPVNPRSGVACPSPELYSPIRPDAAGTPTVVGLTMMFQDISRFSDTDQTMTADVYVLARWRDPRLADPARGEGSADCPVPGKELWMPAVEPENLRSRQLFYEPRFLVDANGTVTLARRVLVEVGNPLDLHEFPFDRHQFRITLWPTVSRADEVRFHPLHRGLTITSRPSVLGWDVSAPVASVAESDRLGRQGVFSRYDVVIGMTRDWGFYAWKLGVPLLLIVLMAYTIYFIPATGVAQQVAVGMTSMLTLVAYMLALGSSLPKISYLTRADRLFIGCAILVFLGLVKAILTIVWVQKDAKDLMRITDRWGRWLYPVALLLVVLTALVL